MKRKKRKQPAQEKHSGTGEACQDTMC